jgi:pyridinium-3,5-bisthiocarboxylic acid mononucleotide nickel chelatase
MTQEALMRIAYLECFSGISGDMFVGALLDAGIAPKILEDAVAALNIGAYLEISRVNRSGIDATKLDVLVKGSKEGPGARVHEEHSHHSHDVRPHPDSQQHGRHHHGQGRGLDEIKKIIGSAELAESAKLTAILMFEKLGAAESKIHNVPIESVHFHEVGAVDAMVDIVCAAVGSEALGADEFISSPLNLGGGMVECAHGTFPVPAPATVELLKGAPVYSSGIQAELVTPTGAAIVATLAKRFEPFPAMTIEKTGYGAGSRDFDRHANVVRVTVGTALEKNQDTHPAPVSLETVSILEANLDDLNPQVFGYVMERLLAAGALDVFGTPVNMKKNRPGMLLTVLSKPEEVENLAQIIFAETTTLGVRRREEKRQVLRRKWQTISTHFGAVRIKIASMDGTVTGYAPEYEDCRRIAAEQRVPLKMVMQEALQEFLKTSK